MLSISISIADIAVDLVSLHMFALRVKSDRVIVTASGGADTVPTEVGSGCSIQDS